MNINDLIERAAKYDAGLARDISRFAGNRRFGLVYEESKPEFVRLYNKPIVIGDIVNILPPRGVMENMTSDVDEHETRYSVLSIADGKAHLKALESEKETDIAIEDIVALSRFDEPIYAGLKEVDRVERGGDKPYQVVINGENFYALETMMFAYQGKVDCIYIDPPYNTGAKDWKYNNNYVGQDDRYRHSKWLTFMEDRLRLAKKLLNPNDSVLICTIDEKEYLRLGLLLEQIFPEASIQMTTIVINRKGSSRTQFARVEEYAFFVFLGNALVPTYSKDYLSYGENSSDNDILDSNPRWERLLRGGTGSRREDSPTLFYPVYVNPEKKVLIKAGEVLPLGEDPDLSHITDRTIAWPIRKDGSFGRWQASPDTFNELIKAGYAKLGTWDKKRNTWTVLYLNRGTRKRIDEGQIVITGRDPETNTVSVKFAQPEAKMYEIKSVWFRNSHDSGVYGSTLLRSVIGHNRHFDFPKSLYSTKDAIQAVLRNKKHALVIDYFAGSGTTLHAINLLNAEDGGSRQCICITNNEVSEAEARKYTKEMLRQGDAQWEAHGIAHAITWPRTVCTIEGHDINGKNLLGNYGCEVDQYEIVEGNIEDPESGEIIRGKFYKKTKKPLYPELVSIKKSDGFNANAVFYDLEYLEPSVIAADLAFDEIAPLLWMKAGSRGRVIQHGDKYDISENYAVLFNYCYSAAFVRELKAKPDVKMVFIVTDYDARYRSMCSEFPDKTVVQLYESYLRSFEISSEG